MVSPDGASTRRNPPNTASHSRACTARLARRRFARLTCSRPIPTNKPSAPTMWTKTAIAYIDMEAPLERVTVSGDPTASSSAVGECLQLVWIADGVDLPDALTADVEDERRERLTADVHDEPRLAVDPSRAHAALDGDEPLDHA